MDKTGDTLCYSPERVCTLIITTMVLHYICIDHGIQWQVPEIANDVEPIEFFSPDAITPSGQIVRQEGLQFATTIKHDHI